MNSKYEQNITRILPKLPQRLLPDQRVMVLHGQPGCLLRQAKAAVFENGTGMQEHDLYKAVQFAKLVPE